MDISLFYSFLNRPHPDGEVERVKWDLQNDYIFYCGTDTGVLTIYDVRNDAKPLSTISAHPGTAVTGLAPSSSISGCLATVGDDVVRVWNLRDPTKPRQVYSRPMCIGQLTCIQGSPDAGLIFALAGERQFRVVDLSNDADVCEAFELPAPATKARGNKRGIVIEPQHCDAEDGEEDDDEGDKRSKKKSASDSITVIDGKSLSKAAVGGSTAATAPKVSKKKRKVKKNEENETETEKTEMKPKNEEIAIKKKNKKNLKKKNKK